MIEAENSLIGCILLDNNSIYDVYNTLRPDMFETEFCRDCYAEMIGMYDRGEVVNVISLSQALENHKWDKQDIGVFLRDCFDLTATSAMIKSYAESIIKSYKSRTVKELFRRVSLAEKDIDGTGRDVAGSIS